MKKVVVVLLAVALGVGLYLGWRWSNVLPDIPVVPSSKESAVVPPRSGLPVDESPEIRIGVISPLRKGEPGAGTPMEEIVEFCVDRRNLQGGIHGKRLKVVSLYCGANPIGAARAAREIVDTGVVAVIGGWFSSNAVFVAKTLQEAGVPMIATGASNPAVTRAGDYVFRTNFSDPFQSAVMAEFAARRLGARSAALLVNQGNVYSPYLAEAFKYQFRGFGGQVSWKKDYLADSESFDDLFKSGIPNVDVVYLPGYEKESVPIVLAARRAGIRSVFLGADGWVPSMLDRAGQAIVGSYYTKAWHPDIHHDCPHGDVVRDWIAHNGPIMRDITVLTLDAAYLLFDAIERASSISRDAVRDALASTRDFCGATGTFRFDAHGDPDKPLAIMRMGEDGPEFVQAVEPRAVKIGVIFAKTGDAEATNVIGFEAARFAAEELNRLGGVLSHRIQLIEYDNESTPLGSRQAAMRAVEDGVAAVVGAAWSSHSAAMAPVLQEAGIPMVTPSATHPGVTLIGNCIFRVCFTDHLQSATMARFALEDLKAKTAAILVNASSEYSVGLATFFRQSFSREGKVVLELDYLQSTNDFGELLQQVKATSPDVVFVPGYHREAAYIIQQARKIDIRSVFLGGDGWNDLIYDYAGEEVAGSYYAENWHADFPNETSRAFVRRYPGSRDVDRSGLVALTYDAVYLLTDAMRRAGDTEPRAVRDALARTTDFEGITGRIRFDENGDPSKPIVILRLGKKRSVFHALSSETP